MSKFDATVNGSCLCGAVRFQATLPSLLCGHCHCSMCRRNHGAEFVTWLALPRDPIELPFGATRLSTYSSSEHDIRKFSSVCGSSLFYESKKHPNQIDIPLANIGGPIDRAPQLDFSFDSRAPWGVVSGGLPLLGGTTGMEPPKAEPDA